MSKSFLRPALATLAILVGAAGLTAPTYAGSGSSKSSAKDTKKQEIRLEARMRAGRVEAKVAWRKDEKGRLKLQAEVYRAKPNTKFVVTHKGKPVATITTNSLGNGRVEFERTNITMAAGDPVAVGEMKGTLVRIR